MILIAAIDPGKTTGIALLDVKGNVIKVTSLHNARTKEIINFIIKHGKPIIIASDVNPVPHKVKKIASELGAVLFYPSVSMRIKEKLRIIKGYDINFNNYHEIDALAAAIKAYKRYRNFFAKLNYNEKEIELKIKNRKAWLKK